MRTTRTTQASLFDPTPVDHPVADDLERVSAWLDAHPELIAEVEEDLGAKAGPARGRHGLSCETVLRCALLKHIRQETYRGLEFLLRDSLSAQRGTSRRRPTPRSTVATPRSRIWRRPGRSASSTPCSRRSAA